MNNKTIIYTDITNYEEQFNKKIIDTTSIAFSEHNIVLRRSKFTVNKFSLYICNKRLSNYYNCYYFKYLQV